MVSVMLTGNIACCSRTAFQCKFIYIRVDVSEFVVRLASLIKMALNILADLSFFFHSTEEDYYLIRKIFMR
jgi:hypothetical protein